MGWGLDDIVDGAGDVVSGAAGKVGDIVSDIVDGAGDAGRAAGKAAGGVAGGIGDLVSDLADQIKAAEDEARKAARAVDAMTGLSEFADHQVDEMARLADDLPKVVGRATDGLGRAVDDARAGIEDVIDHPLDSLTDAARTLGKFVDEHRDEIVTGFEIAANIALYASGVGAPIAAGMSGAMVTSSALAHGKDFGEAIADGAAAAGDKLFPGAGSAARAVITGLENGDSADKIAGDAGLKGLGATGGPALGYTATLVDDISHDRSPGRTILDLLTQYGNDASGAGTEHANPLGQVVVIGANDIADGKGIDQFGMDLLKLYVHQAAGGDVSPTAQLADTLFDDLGAGKSAEEIGKDLLHQGKEMADRVEQGSPGALDRAIGDSGLPGSDLAARAVGDLLEGKSLEDTATDLATRGAEDLLHHSGLRETLEQAGINTDDLDPLRPIAEAAVKDLLEGKSGEEIAIDLAKLTAHAATNEIGGGEAAHQAADTILDGIAQGRGVEEIGLDLAKLGLHAAADETGYGDHGTVDKLIDDLASDNPGEAVLGLGRQIGDDLMGLAGIEIPYGTDFSNHDHHWP